MPGTDALRIRLTVLELEAVFLGGSGGRYGAPLLQALGGGEGGRIRLFLGGCDSHCGAPLSCRPWGMDGWEGWG